MNEKCCISATDGSSSRHATLLILLYIIIIVYRVHHLHSENSGSEWIMVDLTQCAFHHHAQSMNMNTTRKVQVGRGKFNLK